MKYTKCRKRIFFYTLKHYLSYFNGLSVYFPVLGYTIMILSPAAIYGCTPTAVTPDTYGQETVLRLMRSENEIMEDDGAVDILMFNDDKAQKLDAYQRTSMSSCSTIRAASTAGNKIMTVLMNSQRDLYDWTEINSYGSMEEICVNLEQEVYGKEAMSGEYRGKAGYPANVQMQRLSSEVVLRSISCDFSGKPYSGSTLRKVRVYLTNVNAEAPLLNSQAFMPRRLVNTGGLDMKDVSGFREPDMIYRELTSDIGALTVRPDIRLRCYPNESPEEVPGAPFTRLVVEGEIEGEIYYWPVNINRDDSGKGIERNMRYIFDIRITRLGHSSADIPVEIDKAEIISEIQTWDEKEEYGVRF